MFSKNESGRSMIEMLGVLAIIGILSAGGIAGYTMAMKNYRANKAMEKFQLISTEIITSFGDSTNFAALNNENNVRKLNLDRESPYNGDIVVNGDNGYFTLTMNNVPEQACIKITQSPWGDDYVFGTSEQDATFTKSPYDCDGSNNTLVMTYQHGIATSLGGGSSSSGGASSGGAGSYVP